MAKQPIGYNERAWAIDVISEIRAWATGHGNVIRRAGGENTIRQDGLTRFPDAILYGEAALLQGWELKCPETPITDAELLRNARAKAELLKLDSFLVWNGPNAVLYVRDSPGSFTPHPHGVWTEPKIKSRKELQLQPALWQKMLHDILRSLDGFFSKGTIAGRKPSAALGSSLLRELLDDFGPSEAGELARKCKHDAKLRAELDDWWTANKQDYLENDRYLVVARLNILQWANRLLFAHHLKGRFPIASEIERLKRGTTLLDARTIFRKIAIQSDFACILGDVPPEDLSPDCWGFLLAINELLTEMSFASLPLAEYRLLLDGSYFLQQQKLAGQYATPPPLAHLLVRLAVRDLTKPIFDPCCGTGTIARFAQALMREHGVAPNQAVQSIWAADKYPFPLALARLSLADVEAAGQVLQVFQSNAFDLRPGLPVKLPDAYKAGTYIQSQLPKFGTIVSNLPFVRFESKQKSTQAVMGKKSGRFDLFADLILHLSGLLGKNGHAGFIVSNSWLGTDWGAAFRQELLKTFAIRAVVVSANGRWFTNAQIATSLLILHKRPSAVNKPPNSEDIQFCLTKEPIQSWTDDTVATMGNSVVLNRNKGSLITQNSLPLKTIAIYESVGVGWPAYFVKLNWLDAVRNTLVPVTRYFRVFRGERRGWDALFFPSSGHGIESRFIRPALFSTQLQDTLIAQPDREAFCCGQTIAQLNATGCSGALGWIRRFRTATNGTGKKLPDVLERAGMQWYEMRPDSLADLALSLNPDKKLVVYRLDKPTFVNQRLVAFTSLEETQTNIELQHALLNSVVGMFLMEAAGFGRGLGALDLNATKLRRHFHMLDQKKLNPEASDAIRTAFAPLLARTPLPLPEELAQTDREIFDQAVLGGFGLAAYHAAIKTSLLQLFNIRQTARKDP